MATASDQKANRNQNHNREEPGESFTHSWAYLHFACLLVSPVRSANGVFGILRRREISHICVSGKRGKSKLHKDLLEPQEAVGVARTHWANVKTSDC